MGTSRRIPAPPAISTVVWCLIDILSVDTPTVLGPSPCDLAATAAAAAASLSPSLSMTTSPSPSLSLTASRANPSCSVATSFATRAWREERASVRKEKLGQLL
ncbi:hypothetical protein EUGRSUZ_F00300 [Eucalyptus grandis]|uniref:Uncharacterized protein n=2 Tax=Eucalyptus grandis TaxID=71139 RepID=A0ACC3KBX9_EUCGR|nr:hypothetical protein EUGRSUZ_F00300 [Eucalyptus grandis]